MTGPAPTTSILVLCGLPGTGKSTLAAALAPALGAALLDKDRVRAALFAPEDVAHEREQDDLCCRAMHAAVEDLVARGRRRWIVLDGRTYSRRDQVDEVVALAARLGAPLAWVECTCDEATVRRRLAQDAATGRHAAANRTFELHQRLLASADPLPQPRLVLRTDDVDPAELVRRVLAWLEPREPGR